MNVHQLRAAELAGAGEHGAQRAQPRLEEGTEWKCCSWVETRRPASPSLLLCFARSRTRGLLLRRAALRACGGSGRPYAAHGGALALRLPISRALRSGGSARGPGGARRGQDEACVVWSEAGPCAPSP